MKTTIIAIIFILTAEVTMAQQELLSFDEHNKYIYYQIVELPGLNADTLETRGLNFLKTQFPRVKLKQETSLKSVKGEGKFLTYGGISVLKHENGEMSYLVSVEFKDQKYRFWLTDFVFTPYERDRYGNFVPKAGIEIPLESASSRLEKKELDSYLNETGTFCKQFGEKLKIYELNLPKQEESTKKVVTDKW